MDTAHNLLIGALALQAGLIDSSQFVESCQRWATHPEKSLGGTLVEGGWLSPADVPHLEYLLQRAFDKHHGDTKAVLAALPALVRATLFSIENIDSLETLHGANVLPEDGPPSSMTSVPPAGDRYEYLSLYAAGGIGRVWMARDRHLDREIAIKDLSPDSVGDPRAVARFLREARMTAQLGHPGIVPVYEVGARSDTSQPFYTMRLVRGQTLTSAIKTFHGHRSAGSADPLEFVALLTAFVTACNTIAYAHSRGVLHRDLKGDNIILGNFGEVIVLDWGLAKHQSHADEKPADVGALSTAQAAQDPNLTMQGEIVGTPAYMAPEQAEGRVDKIDQRTDIYGLGGILYEILTGQPPFVGGSTLAVLLKAARGNPPTPHELWAEAPPALEAVCLKAMAREPEQRFASAAELAQEVQRWQDVQRRKAEEALKRQTEVLRSILDLIPGVVWTALPDGSIDYANQYWLTYTGLTLEETLGTGWASKVHPDDLPRVIEQWTGALESGIPVEVDYRLRRAEDGAYRWFLAQSRPVRDQEGRIIKWFGMLTAIEDQKQSEKALERQNALVRLLHRVTVAAYEAVTFEDALQAGIDQVCTYTGWPVGHVYLVGAGDKPVLIPTKIWHLARPADFQSFVAITEATPLAHGAGLPGRVFAGEKPCWIMDVTTDPNFPRAKAAANLGVKGAFGFPVLTDGRVVAVLEFFTKEPQEPDDVLLAAMEQIGIQLGQVFARKKSEAELNAARAASQNKSI